MRSRAVSAEPTIPLFRHPWANPHPLPPARDPRSLPADRGPQPLHWLRSVAREESIHLSTPRWQSILRGFLWLTKYSTSWYAPDKENNSSQEKYKLLAIYPCCNETLRMRPQVGVHLQHPKCRSVWSDRQTYQTQDTTSWRQPMNSFISMSGKIFNFILNLGSPVEVEEVKCCANPLPELQFTGKHAMKYCTNCGLYHSD